MVVLPPGLPCCKTQSKGLKKPIVLTATIPVWWGKQRTAAAPPQLASQGGGTVWDQTWLPGAALRAAWNLPEPAGAALGNLLEGSVKIVAQAPHLGAGFRSERLEQGSQPSRCLCCQHSGWQWASGMPSLCKGTEAHPQVRKTHWTVGVLRISTECGLWKLMNWKTEQTRGVVLGAAPWGVEQCSGNAKCIWRRRSEAWMWTMFQRHERKTNRSGFKTHLESLCCKDYPCFCLNSFPLKGICGIHLEQQC